MSVQLCVVLMSEVLSGVFGKKKGGGQIFTRKYISVNSPFIFPTSSWCFRENWVAKLATHGCFTEFWPTSVQSDGKYFLWWHSFASGLWLTRKNAFKHVKKCGFVFEFLPTKWLIGDVAQWTTKEMENMLNDSTASTMLSLASLTSRDQPPLSFHPSKSKINTIPNTLRYC